MTQAFLIEHGMRWAMDARNLDQVDAERYATWYAMEFPEGDVSHQSAFDTWWEINETLKNHTVDLSDGPWGIRK